MANEITVSASLYGYKAGSMSLPVGRGQHGLTFTLTGTVLSQGTVSVGTTEEAIPLGEVTTPHWAWLKNLGSTNYVSVRPGSGTANLIRMLAGEPCLIPINPLIVPFWIADTAVVLCEYLVFAL